MERLHKAAYHILLLIYVSTCWFGAAGLARHLKAEGVDFAPYVTRLDAMQDITWRMVGSFVIALAGAGVLMSAAWIVALFFAYFSYISYGPWGHLAILAGPSILGVVGTIWLTQTDLPFVAMLAWATGFYTVIMAALYKERIYWFREDLEEES